MQSLFYVPLVRFAALLCCGPLFWFRRASRQHALAGRRVASVLARHVPASAAPLADALRGWQAVPAAASFDAARDLYAESVRLGHAPRSLLASARFERGVHCLERVALGPWARTV